MFLLSQISIIIIIDSQTSSKKPSDEAELFFDFNKIIQSESIFNSIFEKIPLKNLEDNSFDCDMMRFDLDYHNYFYYGGSLLDVEIPVEKVQKFIKKHESSFNTVADEFIKKINSFEK